jgi:hypothetical protein
MKAGALIFGGFFVLIGGIVMGMEIGYRQRDALPDKILAVTKACPRPDAPAVRWQCDAVERREYLNVCLKRGKTT